MYEYISKEDLKRRYGWTARLIDIFLPEPDKYETNPQKDHYPEMRLYSIYRIQNIEMSEEFHQARKVKRGRKKKTA